MHLYYGESADEELEGVEEDDMSSPNYLTSLTLDTQVISCCSSNLGCNRPPHIRRQGTLSSISSYHLVLLFLRQDLF